MCHVESVPDTPSSFQYKHYTLQNKKSHTSKEVWDRINKFCGATQIDEKLIRLTCTDMQLVTVTGTPRQLLLTDLSAFGCPHKSIQRFFHCRIPSTNGSLWVSEKLTTLNHRFRWTQYSTLKRRCQHRILINAQKVFCEYVQYDGIFRSAQNNLKSGGKNRIITLYWF